MASFWATTKLKKKQKVQHKSRYATRKGVGASSKFTRSSPLAFQKISDNSEHGVAQPFCFTLAHREAGNAKQQSSLITVRIIDVQVEDC